MNRKDIADLLVQRLGAEAPNLKARYESSRQQIGHFFIDDLLPEPLAKRIHACFPEAAGMKLKKSLKEYKYVAAQMNRYDPILEETVYAFQDPRVVTLISSICGIGSLYPDEHLYAGGISLMGAGHYLNPHLDNSHDKDRHRWRVLNLLYYVTPDWELAHGGNLELWPGGLKADPVVIHSRFNRLVVMATHDASWHSVSPIASEASAARCCVSNYYFSDQPLKAHEQFHVTSFRGRPEQPLRDLWLRADIRLRMAIRKIFRRGLVQTDHVYKK